MTVTIRVFASLREEIGRSTWQETLAEGSDSDALLAALSARHESISRLRPSIRLAINDQWTSAAVRLSDGDEVALLTPVSGG